MRKNYQRKERKSNHKFEVIGGQLRISRAQCMRHWYTFANGGNN